MNWRSFLPYYRQAPRPYLSRRTGSCFFREKGGEIVSKPAEIVNHGHWPMRYRAVFVLWGAGFKHETLPEISMKEIAGFDLPRWPALLLNSGAAK